MVRRMLVSVLVDLWQNSPALLHFQTMAPRKCAESLGANPGSFCVDMRARLDSLCSGSRLPSSLLVFSGTA